MATGHPSPPVPLPVGRNWIWRCGGPFYHRIFHRDDYTPQPEHRRAWGPSLRFDQHLRDAAGQPYVNPDRTVMYLGEDIRTCGLEALGLEEPPYIPTEVYVCERFEVASFAPEHDIAFQDIVGEAATDLRALQSLGSGQVTRSESQEWARAIYDDRASRGVHGIRYVASRGGGNSLALWDGSPELTLMHCEPLHHPGAWHQLRESFRELQITATQIPMINCVRCLKSGVINPAAFVPPP